MKSNARKYIRWKKQPYNKPFTERELKAAIKQEKNTAPSENTIHPDIIKRSYNQKP